MINMDLQHFILTRFNILIWRQDKDGINVRTTKWLEHRFLLFEKYCLPSIKKQTCPNFEWIVLFDSKTPDCFKTRIMNYQKECPQFIPVFVEPEKGRFFAEVFRSEVIKRMKAPRVLTTYLDNDDALNIRFIEDIQQRISTINDGTFIYYNDGYQFFADGKYLMRVYYPTNHFVSVMEKGEPASFRCIFGFGSHATIEKIKGVKIEYVNSSLMWCEVVHETNVMNDAKFLNAKMVGDEDVLKRDFAIDETVEFGFGVYLCKFWPRYIRHLFRRAKYSIWVRTHR